MKKYLFVCFVAYIGTANASFLSINNAGFEAQVLGDGAFNLNVSGWGLSGRGGTFNPTNSQFPSGASEGENTAWTQGGIISQNLTDNLESSFIYTLTVDVGNAANIAFGGYNIQLLAGGNVIAEDNNSLTPLNGEFITSSLSYTSFIGDVLLGQGLEVRLSRFGSVGETNFDNVTLEQTTVSSVPAPAAVLLFGSGLIGLVWFGKKSKPPILSA